MLPSKADFSFYRGNVVRKCNKNYLQKENYLKLCKDLFTVTTSLKNN